MDLVTFQKTASLVKRNYNYDSEGEHDLIGSLGTLENTRLLLRNITVTNRTRAHAISPCAMDQSITHLRFRLIQMIFMTIIHCNIYCRVVPYSQHESYLSLQETMVYLCKTTVISQSAERIWKFCYSTNRPSFPG